MLEQFRGKPVRVLIVWEPVLLTDWASPSTAVLGRVSDSRVVQFWDKGRLISRSIGERDRHSIVWDYIAIYPAGPLWRDSPPKPLYQGAPLIRAMGSARAALAQSLK